jgi:hypothetical protein
MKPLRQNLEEHFKSFTDIPPTQPNQSSGRESARLCHAITALSSDAFTLPIPHSPLPHPVFQYRRILPWAASPSLVQSVTPIIGVSSIMFKRQDHDVALPESVQYRIGKFRNPANSHTRLKFPEPVRLKNDCRDCRFDSIDEPFSCLVVKQDGFAKFVSSVRMKLETHC